jgi:YfiH family protein
MTPPPFLASPTLSRFASLRHGFFGRLGGVSGGVYASLNAGPGSRDAPEAVAENRRRIAEALGVAEPCLLNAHQAHTARAVVVEAPWQGARPEADGLATRTPGLALAALAADCAPVLFADSAAGVIGAAHAGWRGALGGVLEATLAAMESLGGRRSEIAAAIGPTIGPASFEVGPELRQSFCAERAAAAAFFAPGRDDRYMLDLPGYCAMRLAELGLAEIDHVSADTLSDDRFFSHRRSVREGAGDYGRNLSAIVLSAP